MDQDDVLWLDVAVQHFVLVQVAHCLQQVSHDEGGGLLGEGGSVLHQVVELPVAAHLHDGVDVLFVGEAAVVADDVGVLEESLQLQFAHDLSHHVLGHHLLLRNRLQCHYHPRLYLQRQEYVTELAFAHTPQDLEVLLANALLLHLWSALLSALPFFLSKQEGGQRLLAFAVPQVLLARFEASVASPVEGFLLDALPQALPADCLLRSKRLLLCPFGFIEDVRRSHEERTLREATEFLLGVVSVDGDGFVRELSLGGLFVVFGAEGERFVVGDDETVGGFEVVENFAFAVRRNPFAHYYCLYDIIEVCFLTTFNRIFPPSTNACYFDFDFSFSCVFYLLLYFLLSAVILKILVIKTLNCLFLPSRAC